MNTLPYISIDGLTYRYGEFFPPEFSPFSYEESSVSDYFPKKDFLKTQNNYNIEISLSELPEKISDINDSIINKVIECQDAQKCAHRCVGVFKITQMEFQFYKRFNIPLPRMCPNCRFYTRMEKLNPIMSRNGVCMCKNNSHGHTNKCSRKFKTNYSSDNPQILFCEECYKQEIY